MTAAGTPEGPVAGPSAAQVAIFWDRLGRNRHHLSKKAHGGAETAMWCGLDGADEDMTMAPLEYRAPGDPGAGRFGLRMLQVCAGCVVEFRTRDMDFAMEPSDELGGFPGQDQYGALSD